MGTCAQGLPGLGLEAGDQTMQPWMAADVLSDGMVPIPEVFEINRNPTNSPKFLFHQGIPLTRRVAGFDVEERRNEGEILAVVRMTSF